MEDKPTTRRKTYYKPQMAKPILRWIEKWKGFWYEATFTDNNNNSVKSVGYKSPIVLELGENSSKLV